MARLDRSPFRASHPDDVLRRLARTGRPILPPSMSSYDRRDRRSPRLLLGVVVLVVLSLVAGVPFVLPGPTITVAGLAPGESLRAASAARRTITVSVKPSSATARAKIKLDGEPVAARLVKGRLTFILGPMVDGPHHLSVNAGSSLLLRGPAHRRLSFTVDSVAPKLSDITVSNPVTLQTPVTVTGRTDPAATVRVNGVTAVADQQGSFALRLPRPPIGAVRLSVDDAAGNVRRAVRPSVVAGLLPDLRGVHVSQAAWADAKRRQAVLALADAGRITAVELDIKDEDGRLGHTSTVPLANQLGASRSLYDLKAVVDELHSRKLVVVGRVVVFRDPLLVAAAIRTGHPEQVVQDPTGAPLRTKTGSYTNPGNEIVRNYNSAVALEAATAGVDAVMLDYLGAPEGDLATMRFPGLETAREPIVSARTIVSQGVSFLDATAAALAGTATRLGAAIPGASVQPIGLPKGSIARLARSVDFLAPTIYPSTFRAGAFGVADPPASPGDLAERATAAFQESISGTGVRLVPRLQDFSLIRDYGDKQVRAQIDGVARRCVGDFLMWDAKVTYHAGGLPVGAATLSNCTAR